MVDFLGASEITARTEIVKLDNRLKQAQMEASKINDKNLSQTDKLKKVSQEFESIFLGYMLKQMRKTVPEDPLFGNSTAKDIFYEMYDDAVARELSKAGGIGLASLLYKQLSQIAISSYQKNKEINIP